MCAAMLANVGLLAAVPLHAYGSRLGDPVATKALDAAAPSATCAGGCGDGRDFLPGEQTLDPHAPGQVRLVTPAAGDHREALP